MTDTSFWIYLSIIAILLLVWFLYLTRSGRDDNNTVQGRLHRAYRRIIFWLGDIRALSHFPFVTWDVHNHKVEYQEAVMILSKCRKGDVGIHRDAGFLSNLGIPGFMKHAWIHVSNEGIDIRHAMIVEAISEGVMRRHGLFPIRSDYTVILRPRNVSEDDINRAVKKAESIVGCKYDASFKFDIENEIELFTREINESEISGEKIREDRKELDIAQNNIKADWDGGFSCTETISFAWWHQRQQLRLFRQRARGKDVILADQLINEGWEIIAMSDSITIQVAQNMGLGEEGIAMIQEYRTKHGYNLKKTVGDILRKQTKN